MLFSRRYQQKGVGLLLVLVLVILLIIFFTSIGQSIFSSQVLSQTQRAAIGLNCRYYSRSVLEEALWQLQRRANEPGDPLFEKFRSKVFGNGPASFEIEFEALQYSTRLINSFPSAHHYALDRLNGEVVFRRQINGLSYESYGLLKLEAVASAKKFSGITRRTTIYRDAKVALISPPRPFAKALVFLGSAEGIIPWGKPNAQIRQSYLSIRRIWVFVDEALKKARQESIEQEQLEPLIQAKREIEEAAGVLLLGEDGLSCVNPYDWKSNPMPLKENEGGPHYFGDSAVRGLAEIESSRELTLIVPPGDVFELGSLDLLSELKELEEARIRANDAFDTACESFSNSPPSEESEMKRRLEELKDLAIESIEANRKVLDRYFDFQIKMSEKTGKSRKRWLEDFVYKKLTMMAWRKKAFYIATSISDFEVLTKRVQPLSGIVWVENDEKLILNDWKHRGKLIVAVKGKLSLNNVGVENERLDQLTFVCFDDLEVKGRITASLILGLSNERIEFKTHENFTLKGNLISAGPLSFDNGQLHGAIEYDESLDSGHTGSSEKLNHHFVAISPVIDAKVLSRQ